MLTLLPYPDFDKTARLLDKETLNEQIKTVDAIMGVFHQVDDFESPEIHTPGVKMWRGYEPQLCMLGFALCKEYRSRTARIHPMEESFQLHMNAATCASYTMRKPPWFGDLTLHQSHQSYMMRENSRYISFFNQDIPLDLELVWPVLK